MEDAILNWTNWLTVRNLSRATVEGYRYEVQRLASAFPGKPPGEYMLNDLLGFLAERRKKCGDAAIKHAGNALQSFFGYTLKGESPAKELPVPRPKRRQQRTLKHEQALAVLAACDTSSHTGKRDLALVALMLDSGLRAAEACRLPVQSLDLEARLFKVIVKGGQEMFGVYSLETANYLAAWLPARAEIAQAETATLFVSIGGLKPGTSLTTDGLRNIFRRLGQAAGLEHFSPHDLRRTFATLATLMGAPTRLIQLAGRWEDMSQVIQYTRALRATDFDPYSPVAGLLAGKFQSKMSLEP